VSARIRRDRAWELAHLAAIERAAEELAAFAALDAGATRAALDDRLGPLRAALYGSPYYRKVLSARGLGPDDLRRVDDLPHFPTLDRATLAARWRDLPALDGGEIVVARSSGSTAAPAPVVRGAGEPLHMWAVLRFFVARLGVELPRRPRVVLLDGLPGGLEYSARLPLFFDGALHRISIHGPRALDRLARVAAAVVFTDPEGLAWLAAQPGAPAPRLALSSASHLAPELRARIAAPLVNYYSTTESGPIAWECLAGPGRFHVLAPDVWVESVDGELVVTRLRPGVAPLLRYRTGDTGRVAAEVGACACGHRGFTIAPFAGRRACAFVTTAGARVDAWRLAPVLRDLPLRAFRVTQLAPSGFLVEVATDAAAGPTAPLAEAVATALARLGFAQPDVRVERVADLGAAAKPEPFRSLIATSEVACR
jgi:phenylacetate-CoA ligase